MDELTDFAAEQLAFGGEEKRVFWKGQGPAVVLMTEMPGITPEVADCARRFVDAGFTIAMPDLFGQAGRPRSTGYLVSSLAKACISREFVAFAVGRTSPVTTWLRQLVAEAHRRAGAGVGVVGMCFTGGFALALAVDPTVKVAVMSQPALPMAIGAKRKADVGLSPEDLQVAAGRVAADEVCAIGLRFTGDAGVPADRFRRLERELGERFIGVELDSSPGNPHGFPKAAHSVLTDEYGPEPTVAAFEMIVDHLNQRL